MSGRIPLPNYTQVPNIVLDSITDLTGGETKVILAICRQTFGFHERKAELAISRLMAITGLAKASVVAATKALVGRGWLKKTRARDSHAYEVNLEAVGGAPGDVQKVNTCSESEQAAAVQKADSACSKTSPEGVQKVNRSKKEEASKEITPAPKRAFTDAWCEAYQAALGAKYLFQGAKDGKAADVLLALGISTPEIIEIARKAWATPEGFWCKHAATLAGFAARFNDIRQEIKPSTKLPPGVIRGQRPPAAPQANGWDRDRFRQRIGLPTPAAPSATPQV